MTPHFHLETPQSQAFGPAAPGVENSTPDPRRTIVDVHAETVDQVPVAPNALSPVPATRIHSEPPSRTNPGTKEDAMSNPPYQAATVDITLLPLEVIEPHPINPRPWSEKYEAPVDEEKVAELMTNIQATSYDQSEPVLVRPWGERYQLIRGHHRFVAMRELGESAIPAVIREMDDKEAAIALVRMQGKEVDAWSKAEHAYECCKAYGGNGLMTVSEYAQMCSFRNHSRVSQMIQAVEVKKCVSALTHSDVLSVRAATDIASLPESDWKWFGSLCIERDWGEKQRQAAIKTVKNIDIPLHLQPWVDPLKYKREAALEAASSDSPRLAKDLQRWVNAAQKYLEGDSQLPKQRPIWKFNSQREPYREILDVQELFLAELLNLGTPSETKIDKLAAKLLNQLKIMDEAYEQWQAQQASAEEQRRRAEQEVIKLLALRSEYAPVGHNADIRDVELGPPESFDAVITDPPYLLSNGGYTLRSGKQVPVDKSFNDAVAEAVAPDEWVPIVAMALKPGGYLVVTCTEHLLFKLHSTATQVGLEWRQTLIWWKRNAPPLLSGDHFQADFEHVYVAVKPGATPYFGYDDLKHHSHDGKQLGAVLDIPQCGGKERLGWHDTQKPLILAELLTLAYVPPDGLVLDPFAGTGSFTVAAKKLGRKAVWVEKDADFYGKAESRIEQSPFHWESRTPT